MSAEALKGRSQWLTAPTTLAVAAGVTLAVVYAWAAVEIPPGTRLVFSLAIGVVAIVFNFTGDAIEQSRLRTLRRLGDGSLPVSEGALALAAREVMRASETSFWVVLAFLAGGAVITGAVWYAGSSVGAVPALRIGVIGLCSAPLTAVIAHLVVLPRARVVLGQLIALGLPLDRLRAELPAQPRLTAHLSLYAVVAVATPLVLVVDMGLSRADALLTALLGASDTTAMQRFFETEHGAGVGSLAVLGVVVLVMVAASAWLSGQALGDPLSALARETERLAQGRYGALTVVPAELEPWGASLALAALEQYLVQALSQLKQTAEGLGSSGRELGQAVVDHQAGSALQQQSLAATSATTEELARSARQIAQHALQVSSLAGRTLEVARAGRVSAEAFASAMGEARDGNRAIADSVVRLNKRVQQIGRIVDFIDGIADRSDLLALNSELEGHKAGAVGRGFGLVAAEMRRLAESVMGSTREITRLIEEIRDATNAAVMATEAGVKATDAGEALATRVRESLGQIVDFANLSSDAMQSISLATAQQQAGTDQLAQAMSDILRATTASLEASEGVRHTSDDLRELTGQLDRAVQRLKEGA
jgi:methyl-accepting chemotaxis protein